MKKLLIVESPAKAKTIEKFLGGDYVVKSSVGHVRDLPKKGLSIRVAPVAGKENSWTFTPTYEISADKKKVVDELRAAARASDEVLLAPDPDREGEAIAWHLSEVLKDAAKGKPVRRVTYNEITPRAVRNAVDNPGDIDYRRVDAQQARRILDRLVGFKVSPLLWKNLSYGYSLSAGRVQSVALRLLVEREREIKDFVPVAYWVLGVEAMKGNDKSTKFTAKLSRLDGEKPDVKSQEHAATLVDDLDGASLRVASVKDVPRTRHPYPPFTTSTLQQAASSVCGFSPHRTMSLAQKLYEQGLITYMRTDSVNIAQEARAAVKGLIVQDFGPEFHADNYYRSKAGAQQAHEAIRPTDVSSRPGTLGLDGPMQKLYDLIWRRFVASQMSDARLSQKTVGIEAEKDGLRHEYLFTATTTSVVFEGWLKVMGSAPAKKGAVAEEEEGDEVKSLPPLAEGEALTAARWLSDRKETKPPPRYSEASLVKALEENGVGRPSTYAQTIEVLVDRQYATRESRQLVPTQRGIDVSDWLVKKLEPLFCVGYTAQMEEALDKVEAGQEKGDGMLSDFFVKFAAWLQGAQEPPPPTEKFTDLFKLLDDVGNWRAPVRAGKRVYSDEAFVKSVKDQLAEGKKPLSEKQLQALVKIAVAYRDQIPDGENRLVDLGYGPEIDRLKNAPSVDLVKWCFLTIDRIGGLTKNPFLNSLREQVDRGKVLSEKQFSILARSIGENSGALPDAEQVRARLAPYVPGGFEVAPVDPAVPELLQLADTVKEWKEPARRGRRVYDDHGFVKSLQDQYARRSSLSPRQVAALRRILVNYREQIPGFAENAERLGLVDIPDAVKAGAAEADAKADARAERAVQRRRRKSRRA
ncbi:MAG: type I DNA topoisomerase [Kiritimatiellae bacterium]|nr:type I DNA topoisomerase [Kiritimatiellia bacterium]